MSIVIGYTALNLFLLNRTVIPRSGALVTQGSVKNGDLSNWFVKLELTNTGVTKTNNAVLTLRVDQLGTFIRDSSSPIFVDQNAKNNFLIEIQIIQGANKSFTFRGMIGQPQIDDDIDNGEILRIPLVGMEYATREWLISTENYFVSPSVRFANIVNEFSATAGINMVVFNIAKNNLPSDTVLQQNWIPFTPTVLADQITDIIDRLALPSSAGGTFQDFYVDYDADQTDTLQSNVTADLFGGQSSGVVIDPIAVSGAGGQEDNTWITDNIRYKNQCILICDPSSGSLPQAHMIFASKWYHAAGVDGVGGRPLWSSTGVYTQSSTTTYASLVQRQFPTNPDPNQRVRFFMCIANVGPSGTPPESDPTHWQEDFTTNPLTTGFFSPSPWTNVTDFGTNMAGQGNPSSGFVGYFVDWNIAVANYDPNNLSNPTQYYQTLSIKHVVNTTQTTPPSNRQTYNGVRYLVNTPATGPWAGMDFRIAQYDAPSSSWLFSNAPTVGDTITDLNTARVLRYDNTIAAWSSGQLYGKGSVVQYSGSVYIANSTAHDTVPPPSNSHWTKNPTGFWITIWGVDPVGFNVNFGNSSPFHIVANLASVTGPSGITNTGIEATYTWVVPPLGDAKNTSSRGAWLSFWFPYPRLDTSNGGTGYLFGGDGISSPFFGTLDSDNLSGAHNGLAGWNNGTISQDQGKINAIRFKCRVGMFTSTDNSAPISFVANIPMVFWAMDLFDRVFYQEFQLRRNYQWDDITISFGYEAPLQLYFSRGDELPKILGYTIPWDFTLKQKEFTGIQFDWRFVKCWGIMMKAPYTDSGFYINAQQAGWDQFTQWLQQGAANWWNMLIATPLNTLFNIPVQANFLVHHSTIAIDELYFQKELIVSSNQTTTQLANARMEVQHLETETDYLNAVSRAQGYAFRDSFFPQFWHMRAAGDVRARFGQSFVASGPRVPNGTQNLVFAEVKHIIDKNGYFIEAEGVRKFTTSG